MIQVLRETHEAPASVETRVRQAGADNRYGEPSFRVVWRGSRLTWVGGRWTDRDAHGNVIREAVELRRVPKYLPLERWHIERRTPPECYGSPEMWSEQTTETADGMRVPALGPYPARGEYEHCFTLESAEGEFVALTPAVADWIVRAIEWSRRQPCQANRLALAAREDARAREFDRTADDILDESFCP